MLEKIKKFWWIGAIALLIIALIFLASCKAGDIPFTQSELDHEARNNFNQLGIGDQYTNFQHNFTTPQGARIRSVVPVPGQALADVDEALQRQITRLSGMFPAWTAGIQVSDYTVYFIHPNQIFDADGNASPPCVLESIPGAPCVYVTGIKSAGTVLGADDQWEELDQVLPIIVAHQQNQNWVFRDWLKDSIHNESEHARGYRNRHLEPTGVFYYFLGVNDTHPWQWSEARGFVAETPESKAVIVEPVK